MSIFDLLKTFYSQGKSSANKWADRAIQNPDELKQLRDVGVFQSTGIPNPSFGHMGPDYRTALLASGPAFSPYVSNVRDAFHETFDPSGKYSGLTASLGSIADAALDPFGSLEGIAQDARLGRLGMKLFSPYDRTDVATYNIIPNDKVWANIESQVTEQNKELFGKLKEYKSEYKRKYGRMPSTQEVQNQIRLIRRRAQHMNVASEIRKVQEVDESGKPRQTWRAKYMPKTGSPSFSASLPNRLDQIGFDDRVAGLRPWDVAPLFGANSPYTKSSVGQEVENLRKKTAMDMFGMYEVPSNYKGATSNKPIKIKKEFD